MDSLIVTNWGVGGKIGGTLRKGADRFYDLVMRDLKPQVSDKATSGTEGAMPRVGCVLCIKYNVTV